ncbi:MAG: ABC transporter permease [Acidobacteria bacterium]|nr:ABC transporter permease [Acidobacteriota bacterium]
MRLALRFIRRQPGFSVAVILTLALGIGATASVFSVLNVMLLRPLGYRDAGRLAMVWESNPSLGMPIPGSKVQASVQNYLEWSRTPGPFEELAAFADRDFTLTGTDVPERLRGFRATGNLFPLLGARAQTGRLFRPDEDSPGHDQVAVLSDQAWRSRFGGTPDIVGRRVILDGQPREVIGVLEPGFREPPRWGGYQRPAEVWVPMAFSSDERASSSNHHRILYVTGRIRTGATMPNAHREMGALGQDLARQYPERNRGWSINVVPLQEERVSEPVRQSLLVLLAAACIVLLIACFNIGHLFLARASGRRREFAIRAALGASRGQVARQLLMEASVLGVAGGLLGVAVSRWTTRVLLGMQSSMVHRLEDVAVDWRVLLFASCLTLASVLAFGLAPLSLARPENVKPATPSRGAAWLLASEASLTAILLIASGLLLKSFGKMMDVDLGLRLERVLSVEVAAKDVKFFDGLLPRLRALPNVQSVGTASNLPMQAIMGGRVRTAGMAADDALGADFRWADAGYFTTLGIPIIRGRGFTDSEVALGNARVVIVDDTLAHRLHPKGDVVGTGITSTDWPYCRESCQIVGVSQAIRQIGPEKAPRPEVIVPGRWNSSVLVLRAAGDVAALGPAIRRIVANLDRMQPVGRMEWMMDSYAGITEERRFNLALAGTFAGLALALAGIGVFAVTAFGLSQRVREFAIRTAVGAQPRQVLIDVVRKPLFALATGGGLGLAFAVPVMISLRHHLYSVEPTDWTAYAGAAAILFIGTAAALILPARRAARIDPAVALRHN